MTWQLTYRLWRVGKTILRIEEFYSTQDLAFAAAKRAQDNHGKDLYMYSVRIADDLNLDWRECL